MHALPAAAQVAETGRRFRDTVLALGGGRAPDLVFKVGFGWLGGLLGGLWRVGLGWQGCEVKGCL